MVIVRDFKDFFEKKYIFGEDLSWNIEIYSNVMFLSNIIIDISFLFKSCSVHDTENDVWQRSSPKTKIITYIIFYWKEISTMKTLF